MRIAVVADVHFQGGGKLPVIARAWRDVFEISARRGVDLVVIAGDLHDDAALAMGRDATAGDIQAAVIQPMLDHPHIDVIGLVGNHDLRGPGHRSALEYLRALPHVKVVESWQIVNPCLGVSIACLPWAWNSYLRTDPSLRDLPKAEFEVAASARRRALLDATAAEWSTFRGFKLLTGHAEIAGARNRYVELQGGTHVFTVADLRATGADQLAFGHYHMRQLDCYVGSLVQHTHGEEGNPTGFLVVDTTTGQRWFEEVDSPRHFTVTSEQYASLAFRRGVDHVKVRDTEPPREVAGAPLDLPAGTRFERLPKPKETRLRSEDVTVESSTIELLDAWLREKPREVDRALLEQAMDELLTEQPLPPPSEATGGSIDAIRELHLQNIGPHRDTRLVVPPSADGILALVGDNGAGKTFLIETAGAVLWGEFQWYPGPLYDNVREGFTGDCLLAVVFESAGTTYRASRRLHITAKTRSQEAYLTEVTPAGERPIAGPKEADFRAAVRRIAGDKELWLATVFQGQGDTGSLIDAEPAERMLLARRWVGADRFDPSSALAREKSTAASGRAIEMERRAQALSEAPARVERLRAQLAEATAEVEAAAARRQALEERRQAVEAEAATLEAQVQQRAELEAEAASLAERERELASRVETDTRTIGQAEQVLASEPQIRERVERLAELREELTAAEQAAAALEAARARRAEVQAELRAVEAELRACEQAAIDRAAHEKAQLRGDLERVRAQIADCVHQEQQANAGRREAMRLQLRDLQNTIAGNGQSLVREMAEARRHLGDAQAKASRLAAAGCAAQGFLPCSFIDDARRAPGEVASLEAALEQLDVVVEFGDHSHEERHRVAALESELKALTDRTADELVPDLILRARSIEGQLAEVGVPSVTLPSELLERREALRRKLAEPEVTHSGRTIDEVRMNLHAMGNPELELGRLASVREGLPGKRADVDRARRDLSQMASRRDDLARRLEALRGSQAEIERLRGEWRNLRDGAAAVDRQAEQLHQQVGALTRDIENAREDVAELDRLMAEIEDVRRRARAFGVLAEFFGPTGVPQLLIDLALPHINGILADLVAEMDEPTLIEVTTQRDLKGGGSREGLFINVTDGDGTRDIKRHSCGEQGWQRKIFRLALGVWGAERRGRHHTVFCSDEPTLGLDGRNVPRLLSAICRLAARFRQVWIISHDPVLLAGIPTQWHLSKSHDGTVVSSTGEASAPELEIAAVA